MDNKQLLAEWKDRSNTQAIDETAFIYGLTRTELYRHLSDDAVKVDWEHWLSRKTWTAKEAVCLFYNIKPNSPDVDKLPNLPAVFSDLINQAEYREEETGKLSPCQWRLFGLEQNIPVPTAMSDIQKPSLIASNDGQQRPGINGKRDIDATDWYKTKKTKDVEKMTHKQIEKELQDRDISRTGTERLWSNGFFDWNRKQTVWPKKKPGRKSGK